MDRLVEKEFLFATGLTSPRLGDQLATVFLVQLKPSSRLENTTVSEGSNTLSFRRKNVEMGNRRG